MIGIPTPKFYINKFIHKFCTQDFMCMIFFLKNYLINPFLSFSLSLSLSLSLFRSLSLSLSLFLSFSLSLSLFLSLSLSLAASLWRYWWGGVVSVHHGTECLLSQESLPRGCVHLQRGSYFLLIKLQTNCKNKTLHSPSPGATRLQYQYSLLVCRNTMHTQTTKTKTLR